MIQQHKYTLYIQPDFTNNNNNNNNNNNDIINYYLNLEQTCNYSEKSGIDIYTPCNINLTYDNNTNNIYTINNMIRCYMVDNNTMEKISYYIYPTQSISNYPIMMASNIGIIDSNYEGPIITKIRYFTDCNDIMMGTKLFQICAPDLSILKVKVIR